MPAIKDRVEVAVQKIMFATDFSPVSRTAAAYARAVAHRYSSAVQITHVTDAVSQDPAQPDPALTTRLGRMLKDFAGTKAETRLLHTASTPSQTLLEEAQRTQADMIVVGTSSRQGVEKLLVGSTAETIIRNASCPVLTVGPHVLPPKEDPLAFHTILYATDFTPHAAKAAIYALSFAEDCGAHLYLCHVSRVGQTETSEPQPTEQELEASLRRLVPPESCELCTPICVVEHGHTPSALLNLADSIKADLIVLGSRKSSFWLQYIDTGLTPALLAGAKCPVLTVC